MELKDFNNICNTLKEIISGTDFENHVFCVGGCCRDEILNYEIKDIDIAVDLPNGGISLAEWLYDNKFLSRQPVVYPVYSTAQFHLSKFPDLELEAVQTRKEKYEDKTCRNPVTAYGTIQEDCLRRDLTINSLYKNISTGEFLDITKNGVDDIKNEIIRTPVNPNITFDDDPLRMLRCIRFASRYNWKIESETWNGILNNTFRLEIITKERICDELNKMLKCNHIDYAIKLLCESNLIKYIFGYDYNNKKEEYDKIIKKIQFNGISDYSWELVHNHSTTLNSNDYLIRIAFIMLELHINEDSTENIESIMRNLKYSNNEIAIVKNYFTTVKRWVNRQYYTNHKFFESWIYEQEYLACSQEFYENCIKLFIALTDNYSMKQSLERYLNIPNQNFFNYSLPVNGNDIIKILGIKPGVHIKIILNELLQDVFLFSYSDISGFDKKLSREQLLDFINTRRDKYRKLAENNEK